MRDLLWLLSLTLTAVFLPAEVSHRNRSEETLFSIRIKSVWCVCVRGRGWTGGEDLKATTSVASSCSLSTSSLNLWICMRGDVWWERLVTSVASWKTRAKSRKVERVHAKCRFLNNSLIPAGSMQTSEPSKPFSQSESLLGIVLLSWLFSIRTMESASALVHFSHAVVFNQSF